MKIFRLAASAIAVTAVAASLIAPARADANAPFCLELTGQDRVCNYQNIAQCQEAARGLPGSCVPNPR